MGCRTPIFAANGMVLGPGEPGGTLPPGVTPDTFLQWNGILWVPSTWTLPELTEAGDVGGVMTVAGVSSSDWSAPPVIAGEDLYHYAFGNLQVNTGTQHLTPWCTPASGTVANNPPGSIAQFTGTLHTMYATHGTPVAADNIVYTVMVNDVATALAVTLNSGVTGPGSNLVNVVPVNAGDKITLRTTGVTANRQVRPRVQFILEAA